MPKYAFHDSGDVKPSVPPLTLFRIVDETELHDSVPSFKFTDAYGERRFALVNRSAHLDKVGSFHVVDTDAELDLRRTYAVALSKDGMPADPNVVTDTPYPVNEVLNDGRTSGFGTAFSIDVAGIPSFCLERRCAHLSMQTGRWYLLRVAGSEPGTGTPEADVADENRRLRAENERLRNDNRRYLDRLTAIESILSESD